MNQRPAIALNGFEVDARLAALMRRADWPGKRTDAAWLAAFPVHPQSPQRMPFVQLCSAAQLSRENRSLQRPDLSMLWGAPSTEFPPGNIDPKAAYLIGLTDDIDAGIFVDLRGHEARIVYDNLANGPVQLATAFQTIDEFVAFYVSQHGKHA